MKESWKSSEVSAATTDAVRTQDNLHGATQPRNNKELIVSWKSLLVIVAMLVVGLVVFDLTLESRILSNLPESIVVSNTTPEATTCSPTTVNTSSAESHSGHRYYTIQHENPPLPPPVFRGDHKALCNNTDTRRGFSYCLPISGRKDTPFCTAPDRMDLLTQHSRETRCYASVLHLLLVEVYEELQAAGKSPVIAFGSLLGAVRNQSMIPFTEDADLGYSGVLSTNDELHLALQNKGYHFFFLHIWRVCVAPTHPLAADLYDPELPITAVYAVPYLDLYAMELHNDTEWSMEGVSINGSNTLPDSKVRPFSQVKINGLAFDTVHDPEYFLVGMYGDDYMIPKPRK